MSCHLNIRIRIVRTDDGPVNSSPVVVFLSKEIHPRFVSSYRITLNAEQNATKRQKVGTTLILTRKCCLKKWFWYYHITLQKPISGTLYCYTFLHSLSNVSRSRPARTFIITTVYIRIISMMLCPVTTDQGV